jgi:hydrogenase nickel insertion protein HypA
MHETGLAAEAHRVARKTVDSRGGGIIESVTLVVGELAAVEPELLAFAWEAVVAGTSDAGARLVVEWRRATQRCAACGPVEERAAGTWLRLCPRCDGPLVVTGGDELDVRSVAFRDGGDP